MSLNIFSFFRRASSAPAPQLRQAVLTRDHAPVAADRMSLAVPVALVEPVFESESEVVDITSPEQLPAWRAPVQNVVRESDQNACVVLDLNYRSVLVLGTQAFFANGTHSSLIQRLKSASWSVQAEHTTTPEVIRQVREQAEKRQQRASLSSAEPDSKEANVQLYRDLKRGAAELRASDIHIRLNTDSNRSTVRLRIDGRMRDWKTFDTQVLTDAISAAYSSTSIEGTNSSSTFTTLRPINTMTRVKGSAGNTINGRLTTYPITAGCKVVIRVIEASEEAIRSRTLEALGFTRQQLDEDLLPALAKDKGFFMITGSTGDGKTTTLQAAIMAMPNYGEREVYGVEDPNEMEIPGMNHISIQRNPDDSPDEVKRKFDSALITMMRMDPDVMMLGEFRDKNSADFAAQGIVTGHLMMLTIHGNSALDGLFRMVNPPYELPLDVLAHDENFLIAMSQKLIPRLCQHCCLPAHSVMQSDDLHLLREKFGLDTTGMRCANEAGCEHCSPGEGIPGNGEHGRICAAEIIAHPTEGFLDALRARDRKRVELEWRSTRRARFDDPDMRGKTAFEVALYHAATGVVSPLSVMKVFKKSFAEATVFDVYLPPKHITAVCEIETNAVIDELLDERVPA